MLNIKRDSFVKSARNSHFMFFRDFMEYHSHRFLDHSLLVYNHKEQLVAVLPANIDGTTLYSDQGLTLGGFLIGDKIRSEKMLLLFEGLLSYARLHSITTVIYKAIPYIYHTAPCDEDRYALFRNQAKLFKREVSSTINLQEPLKYQRERNKAIKKAQKNSVVVVESQNLAAYWEILTEVLAQKYHTNPVHSLEEITQLHARFPENIKLFVALKENEVVAGSLIFENKRIVHTQYSTNSSLGQTFGALDLLLDTLIKTTYKEKMFFDFGTSNWDEGNKLNTTLIAQKEGFGGRAVVHDFYEIDVC